MRKNGCRRARVPASFLSKFRLKKPKTTPSLSESRQNSTRRDAAQSAVKIRSEFRQIPVGLRDTAHPTHSLYSRRRFQANRHGREERSFWALANPGSTFWLGRTARSAPAGRAARAIVPRHRALRSMRVPARLGRRRSRASRPACAARCARTRNHSRDSRAGHNLPACGRERGVPDSGSGAYASPACR